MDHLAKTHQALPKVLFSGDSIQNLYENDMEYEIGSQ